MVNNTFSTVIQLKHEFESIYGHPPKFLFAGKQEILDLEGEAYGLRILEIQAKHHLSVASEAISGGIPNAIYVGKAMFGHLIEVAPVKTPLLAVPIFIMEEKNLILSVRSVS